MTKNRTPTPVYLDPGMHPGLEVKGLMTSKHETQFFCNVASVVEGGSALQQHWSGMTVLI